MEIRRDFKSKWVIELNQLLANHAIEIWIDGGWGVDALLERQTRPHDDLDIVIQQKDVPILRELLEAQGYQDVERDDTSAWNFVLGTGDGRLIDVHAIVFDQIGNGLYGPIEKGVMYPAASLTGQGTILAFPVKCISPEYMVQFHTGYKPDENDKKDVRALCEKFKIDVPEGFNDT